MLAFLLQLPAPAFQTCRLANGPATLVRVLRGAIKACLNDEAHLDDASIGPITNEASPRRCGNERKPAPGAFTASRYERAHFRAREPYSRWLVASARTKNTSATDRRRSHR